ncbi:MAG TPA: radical SAM protein, partial [Bacillota bacterium]|nr:radical SAM protein [Bacillota bacterium]
MKIYMDCAPDLVRACEDVIRVFYPDAEFAPAPEGADFSIHLKEQETGGKRCFLASVADSTYTAAPAPTYMPGESEYNGLKRMANLAVKEVLEQYTGRSAGPWGTLTGIRPTKLLHRLLNQNFSPAEGARILADCYSLSSEKAVLLQEVALLQRPFLHSSDQAGRFVSIYVGIPFCPTRCVYCSFPGYSLVKHGKLVEPFVQALEEEIRETGRVLRETGRVVETIYVGGGTPTSLSPSQMERVLRALVRELEFTGKQPGTAT